jgi:hypothetical protein
MLRLGLPVDTTPSSDSCIVVSKEETHSERALSHITRVFCMDFWCQIIFYVLPSCFRVVSIRRDRNEFKITSDVLASFSMILFCPCHIIAYFFIAVISCVARTTRCLSLSARGGVGGYHSNQSDK